ncbi:MAG: hypothetical protein WCL22_00965 [bacterium]
MSRNTAYSDNFRRSAVSSRFSDRAASLAGAAINRLTSATEITFGRSFARFGLTTLANGFDTLGRFENDAGDYHSAGPTVAGRSDLDWAKIWKELS